MTEGKDAVLEDWREFYESDKNTSRFQRKLAITGVLSFVFIIAVLSGSQFFLNSKPVQALTKEHPSANLFNVDFLHTPEIITKLKTDKNKVSTLKAKFSLEVSSHDEKMKVTRKMHLITNQLQKRLEAYSAKDLQKVSGIEKLRQEILDKINTITKPVKISQVFIKDFLIG